MDDAKFEELQRENARLLETIANLSEQLQESQERSRLIEQDSRRAMLERAEIFQARVEQAEKAAAQEKQRADQLSLDLEALRSETRPKAEAEAETAAAPPAPPAADRPPSGDVPLAWLAERLEAPLGHMAEPLLEKILKREHLSAGCTEPTKLEAVAEQVAKMGKRLVSSQAAEVALAAQLVQFRRFFVDGEGPAPEPSGGPAEIARPTESVEAEPTDLAPEPEAIDVESASEPEWDASEDVLEPESGQPAKTLAALTLRKETSSPEQVQEGLEMVKAEEYRAAVKLFEGLQQSEADSYPICFGLFMALAKTHERQRAIELGRRLVGSVEKRDLDKFVDELTRLLNLEITEVKGAATKKRMLLELADLNAGDSRRALQFLRQAELLPDEIPETGKMYYLLTRLLSQGHQGMEDRAPYLLGYMRRMTDHSGAELLLDLREIFSTPAREAIRPIATGIMTLAQSSKSRAIEAQERAGAPLIPREPSSQLLSEIEDQTEASAIKFCLDQLLSQNGREPLLGSARFQVRWEQSDAAQSGAVVDMIGQAAELLGVSGLEVRRTTRRRGFLIDAATREGPQVVYDTYLEGLSAAEQRFHVYRKLFQLSRRHLDLFRSAQGLDDAARYELARGYFDRFHRAGATIPAELVETMERLRERPDDFTSALPQLLAAVRSSTGMDVFGDIREFCFSVRPFSKSLDRLADRLASQVAGLAEACYGVVRSSLGDVGLVGRVEERGLRLLYEEREPHYTFVLWRLQNLWADRLEAADPSLCGGD